MRLKDEQKEAIIREKAIQMIVNEGFDGLSMHKLAKEAGISPATIYLYFKNREDLLNQLYIEVENTFSEITLKNFDHEMPFEQGLWLQWKNRFEHISLYPHHFHFMQQFKNSPLVNHCNTSTNPFKEAMKTFFKNAIDKGELTKLPVETYWSIAYGPFYSLLSFHLRERSFMNRPFVLTEEKMKVAFNLVIKSLKA